MLTVSEKYLWRRCERNYVAIDVYLTTPSFGVVVNVGVKVVDVGV